MGFHSFPTVTMSFGVPGIFSSSLTPQQQSFPNSRYDADAARIDAMEKKMDTLIYAMMNRR